MFLFEVVDFILKQNSHTNCTLECDPKQKANTQLFTLANVIRFFIKYDCRLQPITVLANTMS